MPTVAQRHNIPEAISAVHALGTTDYGDCFTVAAGGATDHSPEEWIRAVMQGAHPAARWLIWQMAVGLRLDKRPSPDRVAGWAIGDREDNWIRAEASSWCLTAHAVLWVDRDEVSLALFIRDDRPFARIVRPPVTLLHRLGIPGLLRNSVRRLNRSHEER